jgi:hypothetical protein
MPGHYRESYTPEWEALRARLPDRRFQSGLSRFMSYCTTNGISPPLVTAVTFSRFGAELDAQSPPGTLAASIATAESFGTWP